MCFRDASTTSSETAEDTDKSCERRGFLFLPLPNALHLPPPSPGTKAARSNSLLRNKPAVYSALIWDKTRLP